MRISVFEFSWDLLHTYENMCQDVAFLFPLKFIKMLNSNSAVEEVEKNIYFCSKKFETTYINTNWIPF